MDSGTQQAASLTITVTQAVLSKIMPCSLEWRPTLWRPTEEKIPFLLGNKLLRALKYSKRRQGAQRGEWLLFLRPSSSHSNTYTLERDCKLRYIWNNFII